jgi:hypothetical protein
MPVISIGTNPVGPRVKSPLIEIRKRMSGFVWVHSPTAKLLVIWFSQKPIGEERRQEVPRKDNTDERAL